MLFQYNRERGWYLLKKKIKKVRYIEKYVYLCIVELSCTKQQFFAVMCIHSS